MDPWSQWLARQNPRPMPQGENNFDDIDTFLRNMGQGSYPQQPAPTQLPLRPVMPNGSLGDLRGAPSEHFDESFLDYLLNGPLRPGMPR